jgi:hypothetical protein
MKLYAIGDAFREALMPRSHGRGHSAVNLVIQMLVSLERGFDNSQK